MPARRTALPLPPSRSLPGRAQGKVIPDSVSWGGQSNGVLCVPPPSLLHPRTQGVAPRLSLPPPARVCSSAMSLDFMRPVVGRVDALLKVGEGRVDALLRVG